MRTPNTTFDVYLAGALPPAAPDTAGLMGHLQDRWQQGNECNEGDRSFFWTNILEVPLEMNLPDNYPGGLSQTTVWVPDSTGDAYTVVAVERERGVRGADYLRVYLVKGYVVAITVKEVDGSPSYSAVTTLLVDQADGFVLSQPAANQARLDIIITDALLSLSDITTNNVSTSKHGFAPKAPNDTTKFLRGDGTWAVPPDTNSGGTVTSVGLSLPGIFSVSGSPVTGSGTLTCSLANQSANQVFAGPTGGGAAAPAFRALAIGDLACHDNTRVTNSGTQSIPNNTPTVLTFDTETWDTNGLHSTSSNTSRLTAAVAGKYLVAAQVTFAANATGIRFVGIQKNGATVYGGHNSLVNVAGSSCSLASVALVDLAAGDYVEAFVSQSSGGNLNVSAQSFGMMLLSP